MRRGRGLFLGGCGGPIGRWVISSNLASRGAYARWLIYGLLGGYQDVLMAVRSSPRISVAYSRDIS
jgi:hypothetical protein